jgi:putative membrane protein
VDLSSLPAINACLNGSAALLLISGRLLIARRKIDAHRRVMIAAFCVSSLFLVLYVAHKVWRGFESTTFNAEGVWKLVYLAILFSHVTLAMTVPVLAISLIRLGLRGRFGLHRRIARLAWPIWIYVSATGVIIYALLYPFNPSPG